nr:MAG TPA: hypothetical protein [Caudoviricetes sp.]
MKAVQYGTSKWLLSRGTQIPRKERYQRWH